MNKPKTTRRTWFVYVLFAILYPSALSAQTQEVDLEAFIRMVEENSQDLEIARTDRSLAEVQQDLVRSQIYPMIGGQVGYQRNFLDVEQLAATYADGDSPYASSGMYPVEYEYVDVNDDNEFFFGVSLQQTLFDMSVFRALEASAQYTVLTEAIYETSRHAIITEAKRLYFQALLMQRVLEVRRSSEEIAFDNYEETQRRFENGLASRMQVLRAEVNWKITEPDRTQAERNLEIVRQHIKNLAGLPVDAEITLVGELDEYPELPEFLPASEIRMNRPDYQAYLNERRLRELNISAERATFYPSLSASLEYGWWTSDNSFDTGDPTDTMSLSLTMTVPIFYGGSRFATLHQAQLELRQTTTQIAQKENDIHTELESIRLTLLEAHQRIESAEQTRDTAQEAYDVTRTSLENGLVTQLELKDARVSLEQAQLGYYSAVYDYLSAYFDWQQAIGRGAALIEF